MSAVRRSYVRSDHDGSCFVHYLWGRSVEDSRMTFFYHLVGQAETISDRLEGTRTNARRWEKYRWVAELHNEFVQEMLLQNDMIEEASVKPKELFTRQFRSG